MNHHTKNIFIFCCFDTLMLTYYYSWEIFSFDITDFGSKLNAKTEYLFGKKYLFTPKVAFQWIFLKNILRTHGYTPNMFENEKKKFWIF